MKKILLATTMLVGTAGFASAEVSFSGSAAAGVAMNGTADGGDADPNAYMLADDTMHTYTNASLDVTFSGATDTGLEFGATFGLTTGRSYGLASDDGFAANDGIFGAPEVFVSGSFGRIAFAVDDYDFFDDANGSGDVSYSGTFGAFTVGIIADVDASEFSGSASGTFGGFTLSANADTYGETNASAGYTMGAFTAELNVGQSDVDGTTSSVTGTYSAGAITASATYNDDSSWDVSTDYSANSISAGLSYDSDSNYTLTAGYDLGGGLSLEAGYNNTQDAFVGAAMSF
jgi:outer membrane protein OmpU